MFSAPEQPLLVLDALAPFMQDLPRHRVNWSKIDFAALEGAQRLDTARLTQCTRNLETYCAYAARDGANALSFDDLPHLYLHPTYPTPLQEKIRQYRQWYARWFTIAAEAGLAVYLNADILFYHPVLADEIGRKPDAVAAFLARVCATVLEDFPCIQGVFFRLGECDGQDVRGDFHSELVLRTPSDANLLLRTLLPVFESRQRRLILRTWTVGAYPIGDLMWNPDTLRKVVHGLESSPALVLSMKYGESDFFRYLQTNPLFFRTPVAKLVELQTRREYEGCGEYPSFVGYDYDRVRQDLAETPNLLGAHVWCQTGGWTAFRRLTYLDRDAVWNEINTFVTLRMWRDGVSVEDAVSAWSREHLPQALVSEVLTLLRLSDEVVKELLYLDDFAQQPVYFRRLRLPPQMLVYWDHLFVNHGLRKVLRCFVEDPAAKLRQAHAALEKIKQMRLLAARCGLPVHDLDFMYDSFALFAAAREYLLLPFTPERAESLAARKQAYKARYRNQRYRYAVKLDFGRVRFRRARLRWLINLLMRRERGYRRWERLFVVWLLGKLYPLLRLGFRRFLGGFGKGNAMGIDTVFR